MQETTLLDTVRSLLFNCFYRVIHFLLSASIVIIGYIGLVMFFYASCLVVCSILVNLLTNIATNDGLRITHGIFWCLWSVPIIDLLFSMNYITFSSFFENMWDAVSDESIRAYADDCIGCASLDARLVVIILLMATPLAILVYLIGVGSGMVYVVYIVGCLSILPILVSFLRQILFAWRFLWLWSPTAFSSRFLQFLLPAEMDDPPSDSDSEESARPAATAVGIEIQNGIPEPAEEELEQVEEDEHESADDQGEDPESPPVAAGRPPANPCFEPVAAGQVPALAGQALGAAGQALVTAGHGPVVEPVSLWDAIDPCGLWALTHWHRFFASDLNPLSKKPFEDLVGLDLVGVILQLAIVFVYVILDIIISHDDPLLAFRIVFVLFALPFLLSANGVVLLASWGDLRPGKDNPLRAKFRLIGNTKIISSIFLCLLVLAVIIWGAFLNLIFDPALLQNFDYGADLAVVTNSSSPAVCRVQVQGWSLLQLAGLAMLAQNPTEEAVGSGVKLLFLDKSVSYEIFKGDVVSAVVFTSEFSDLPVIAFQGLALKYQLGILLENILTFWFPTAMDIVIPCFELVNDVFLVNLLNPLVSIAERLFVGNPPMSKGSVEFGTKLAWQIRGATRQRPVIVGHMSGGLVAKAVGLTVNGYTVAFETIRYRDSVMELLTGKPDDDSRDMYNVYSSPSIFAMPEEEITTNIHLPAAFAIFRPPTAYSTFCLLAAGCVSSDAYEALCRDKELDLPYDEYFEHWFRERI
jgi:hypothetical protein